MGNGTEGFGFGVTLSRYDVRDGVAVTKFRAEVDTGIPGILDIHVGRKGLDISGLGGRLCQSGHNSFLLETETDLANSGIALLEKLVPEFTPLEYADDIDYVLEPAGRFFRLTIQSEVTADERITVFDRETVAYSGPANGGGYNTNTDRVGFVIGNRLYMCGKNVG